MVSFENHTILKDFGMRFHHQVEMMGNWNETGLLLAPFFSFLARLSSRPPPQATSDDGAEGGIELFGEAEKVWPLTSERGGVGPWGEVSWGRRINGVSPLLLSPWVNPHGPPLFLWCFHQKHHFHFGCPSKVLWFSKETIKNIEHLLTLKIGNWPIKVAGGIKGGWPRFPCFRRVYRFQFTL